MTAIHPTPRPSQDSSSREEEESSAPQTADDCCKKSEMLDIEFYQSAVYEIDVVGGKAAEAAGTSVETSTGPPSLVDPWDIIPGADKLKPWSELTALEKIFRVSWIVIRLILVLGLLYAFVCSLDVLQDAFQLLGGRTAADIFNNSALINNPISALMIGVLVTVLVQSSSTSTSIVVSMIGAGILQVKPAIPIIMGANIGTTVTNTIVALTQSNDRSTFRRAFAGATVHDAFNWLCVLILLPIEIATGYLYYMTKAMVGGIHASGDSENPQFLKVITVPFTKLICEIDKKVINAIALNSDRQSFPMAKYYCKEKLEYFSVLLNGTNDSLIAQVENKQFAYDVKQSNFSTGELYLNWTEVHDLNSTKCTHLFTGTGIDQPGYLAEWAGGTILLIGALLGLCICLLLLVKILSSLLQGTLAKVVRKSINADFPGKLSFLTGYVAILLGAGFTILVQSSSVFTSALTPLVGMGIVTVERVYPLTLGSNIGTTITSMLAALTADADHIQDTMQISMCHLFFNITGIMIFYPMPFMRKIPISIAKALGTVTAKYRWFAIFYLFLMYLFLPLIVFALSLPGLAVLLGVGIPILVFFIVVVIINIVQDKRPHWLPAVLRDWSFLPKPLRSLEPFDRVMTTALCCCCTGGVSCGGERRCDLSTSRVCSCCRNCLEPSPTSSLAALNTSSGAVTPLEELPPNDAGRGVNMEGSNNQARTESVIVVDEHR
jgi:sodium-dependent phosphate cotransporter